MYKKLLACSLLMGSLQLTQAQSKEDISSIKSLCGCYEVEFKYAETFATDKNYQLKDKYVAKGIEWAGLVEGTDKKFVIQHILVIDDSMIVKHWREDWTYQNTDLLKYNQGTEWKKVHLPASQVAGQWTQSVWEVDDAPRYQGTAVWVHQNGQHFWKNVTDAPLPRREYTKRKDYNVLTRGNTIALTDTGWVHEQDNAKVVRTAGQPDQLVVMEKGYNIYRKIDDSKCKVASQWWAKYNGYWNKVRSNWDNLIGKKELVSLQREVKNQSLTKQLESLESKDATAKQDEISAQIKKILEEHMN
ncbi:MAG: hypothetical protein QM731_27540 [Chitinophagaceae bacterium]